MSESAIQDPAASVTRPVVGVLAIQGDIEKHLAALGRLGAEGRRVLVPKDLDGLVGLILPGGESTTISKGLVRHGLVEPIKEFARRGGAVLGTCAGAILIARASRNHPVPTLGLVDIEAERNAYGTQLDSFIAPADSAMDRPSGVASDPSLDVSLELPLDASWQGMECVFIRAPRLCKPGAGVQVLATVEGEPVLVREGLRWACTFHPELTDDLRVHRAWLEAVLGESAGRDASAEARGDRNE